VRDCENALRTHSCLHTDADAAALRDLLVEFVLHEDATRTERIQTALFKSRTFLRYAASSLRTWTAIVRVYQVMRLSSTGVDSSSAMSSQHAPTPEVRGVACSWNPVTGTALTDASTQDFQSILGSIAAQRHSGQAQAYSGSPHEVDSFFRRLYDSHRASTTSSPAVRGRLRECRRRCATLMQLRLQGSPAFTPRAEATHPAARDFVGVPQSPCAVPEPSASTSPCASPSYSRPLTSRLFQSGSTWDRGSGSERSLSRMEARIVARAPLPTEVRCCACSWNVRADNSRAEWVRSLRGPRLDRSA